MGMVFPCLFFQFFLPFAASLVKHYAVLGFKLPTSDAHTKQQHLIRSPTRPCQCWWHPYTTQNYRFTTSQARPFQIPSDLLKANSPALVVQKECAQVEEHERPAQLPACRGNRGKAILRGA